MIHRRLLLFPRPYLSLGVSKKPAARFRPGPARRPAFNFFKKNNILYFYIYITNSFNKHKRNVAQLVRALEFKLEGRGSNPLLFLPLFKSHFGLFTARPARWRPLPFSTSSLAFSLWSMTKGNTIGQCPNCRVSITEPHPEWSKEPPIDGRARISIWGAHPIHTTPLPEVPSLKPEGRASASSIAQLGFLSAHRNGNSDSSSPNAISWTWSWLKKYKGEWNIWWNFKLMKTRCI